MMCLVCDDSKVAFQVQEATRRALGEYDIHIEMKNCGICETDVHLEMNDFGFSMYPMCPGHELAGVAVGSCWRRSDAWSTRACTAASAKQVTNNTVQKERCLATMAWQKHVWSSVESRRNARRDVWQLQH